MHLHSLMEITYYCRVYRTTSKYCRIMDRRSFNNIMSSMITSDPHSWMFWCPTSAQHYCFRADIIAPKTSDALRSPISTSSRWVSYSPPKIELVPRCLTELDLPSPVVKVGGNSVQSHSNNCNHIVDLRLTPPLKGDKGKGEINIVKQAQYLTNNHPTADCFSQIFHHLQIPQLLFLRRYPPPPLSAS